ncbi:hypothetical protein ABZW02_20310 [Streptomyces sp. NPDC005180]|uniref:hypothetical protein n=1 Tax=Streptomyces sp. NPDC005180 TaxID=3156868 RepID=UPI0033AC609B
MTDIDDFDECRIPVVLGADDVARLTGDGPHRVEPVALCGLEGSHPGDHYAYAQETPNQAAWWVRWTGNGFGGGYALEVLRNCDQKHHVDHGDWTDDLGCTLWRGHPGRCDF